jgi:hypothetical protein
VQAVELAERHTGRCTAEKTERNLMRGFWPRTFGIRVLTLMACAMSLSPRTVSAQTENQSYLPFDRAAMRSRFRMDRIGSFGHSSGPQTLATGVSGTNARVTEDGNALFAGTDRAGRAWSVQMGGIGCGGTEADLYATDLDRNGVRDLVMLTPTCGNGLAPSSHVFTLMFDALGRPVPFEADGYFERLDDGIFDIADLNGDGRADLLYMNYSDGYWITNVYTARGAKWARVRGHFGRHVFPLFTRFTHRPNHRPTTPKAGRRPFAPDLSQVRPNATGRLRAYAWAEVDHSENVRLEVVDSKGRPGAAEPISWYSSFAIVIDGNAGRRVVMLSAGESAMRELLDEIVSKRYRISLYGQRRHGHASPELLWANAGMRPRAGESRGGRR